MWQKKIRFLLILALAVSFIFIQFPFPKSFAVAPIVQSKCATTSTVSNNQNISLTLTSTAIQGNVIGVVVSVQGAANQVINYVNVSDGHLFYPQRVRTVDHSNTLIVAIFSGILNYSGVTTIYTQYHASTNVNNQVVFCAYEISHLTSAVPTQTTHQEGGNQNLATGSTGDVIISGSDYNSGSGSNIGFTGILDSTAQSNIAIGHNTGTYSQTSVSFSEEADASFSQLITTITFTQTGITLSGGFNVLVINGTIYTVSQLPLTFTFTSKNVSDVTTYGYFSNVNGFNWISLSGCGLSAKDGSITPSVSNTCTVTSTYTFPANQNSSSPIVSIVNQIFRVVAYLIPSLIVLFSFIYLGIKLNMHGDALFIMMLLAIGTLSALTSILSSTFVPFYVGIISIIFSLVGFIYYKRR